MRQPAANSLTDAIAQVESSFGKRMRSHDGSHAGWHMMGRAAWADVNKSRKARGLTQWPYEQCLDYTTSTLYCAEYLSYLAGNLQAALERSPTMDELLCAYRCGPTHFRQLKYKTFYYNRYLAAVNKHLENSKNK